MKYVKWVYLLSIGEEKYVKKLMFSNFYFFMKFCFAHWGGGGAWGVRWNIGILCLRFPLTNDLLGIASMSLRFPLPTFCFDPDGTFLRVGSRNLIFDLDVLLTEVVSFLWKQ